MEHSREEEFNVLSHLFFINEGEKGEERGRRKRGYGQKERKRGIGGGTH